MKRFIQVQILLLAWIVPPFSLKAETGAVGLKEAEEIAVENNFELRMLRAEEGVQHEVSRGKFRELFPSVSVSYRRNRNVARRDYDNGNYSVQLNLSQPVYDGGRRSLAYEISRIDIRLSREQYRKARNNLIFEVRKAFLGLQQKREGLHVAEASLENAATLLKKASLERKQGSITELDFYEIQNEYEQRALTLKQSRDEYDYALQDFFILLNLEAGPEDLPEIRPLDLYSTRLMDFSYEDEELYRMALENRPDVKEGSISVDRSRKEFLMAKYSSLPVVSLTGHYGKTGETWPPNTMEWGVGVNFSFSFMGSSMQNDLNVNRSRGDTSQGYSSGGTLDLYNNAAWRQPLMSSKIELNRSKQKQKELLRDIKNSLSRMRRGLYDQKIALQLSDEQLAIQERRFLIERKRYLLGEVSLHDYFREELKMNEGRNDLIQKRVSYILAINQMELEMGLSPDTLGLVEFKEYGTARSADGSGEKSEEKETEKEGEKKVPGAWKPKTRIVIPPAPIKLEGLQ